MCDATKSLTEVRPLDIKRLPREAGALLHSETSCVSASLCCLLTSAAVDAAVFLSAARRQEHGDTPLHSPLEINNK